MRIRNDDAASLTAAFSTGEYDEEEYDVQHIVLADESEPDSAGLTQTFATAADDAPPPWQPGDQENLPAQKSRATLWLVGGVLVVATLLMQLVHYNRDSLARNVAWGETVRSVYSSLGMELFPDWSLNDYEIRGSEAIAGESGPDIMDIRAQIAATGSEPTGLPHIRVVLRDRWSNPVAAKTLGPADYASPESLPPEDCCNPVKRSPHMSASSTRVRVRRALNWNSACRGGTRAWSAQDVRSSEDFNPDRPA